MAKITLTKEQREELENAEKQIKKPQLLKRVQAIKLRDKGMANLEVADFLLLSDQTISNWCQLYLEKGLKELLQWEYKGKISILTLEHQKQLRERNKEKPFDTAAEAKTYIEENFGIKFHLHWVQKIMKKNFSLHSRKQS
jgi:transposase